MKKKPKAPGWGGARPHAGRRRRKEDEQNITLSAHVPESTVNALKEAAEDDGISLSQKTAEILTDWAATQNAADEPEELEPEQEQPDPRTQALNRLADALEKIVERVSIDKE